MNNLPWANVFSTTCLLLASVQPLSSGTRCISVPIHSWTWKYELHLWYLADTVVDGNIWTGTYVVLTFFVHLKMSQYFYSLFNISAKRPLSKYEKLQNNYILFCYKMAQRQNILRIFKWHHDVISDVKLWHKNDNRIKNLKLRI